MIGPIPIDNINIDNISNNNEDNNINGNGNTNDAQQRRNRELWMEHERRQRTIRFLMMFLMMLILMDGEQQSANEELNRKKNKSLRSSSRGHNKYNKSNDDGSGSGSGSGSSGDGSSSSSSSSSSADNLPKDLFRTRDELDQKIHQALYSYDVNDNNSSSNSNKNNPRLKALFDLNNGVDEEKKIWDWVKDDFESTLKEKKAKNGNDEGNDKEKNHNQGKGKGKSSSRQTESLTEEKETESSQLLLEEAKRKVYHYPRNATGHFRGYWTRIDNSNDNQPPSSTNPSSLSSKTDGKTEKGGNDQDAADSNDDEEPGRVLATHEEVKAEIQNTQRHFNVKDSVGVFILPKGTQIVGRVQEQMELFLMDTDSIDMNTGSNSKDKDEATGKGKGKDKDVKMMTMTTTILNKNNNNNTTKGEGKEEDAPSSQLIKIPKPEPDPLYITEPEGRLHFHFFSRSIRGMKEISLIDGYVKIRDINNYGFTDPRKHLFLRLHGVIIHSIGKISLVANDGPLRSAFVIFNSGLEEDENTDRFDGMSTGDKERNNENLVGAVEDTANKQGIERRRLQESIHRLKNIEDVAKNDSDVNHAGNGGGKTLKDKIEDIRTRALWIYSDLFDAAETGGSDWKLFSSNVETQKSDNWYDFVRSNPKEKEMADEMGSQETPFMLKRRRLLQEEDVESDVDKKSSDTPDATKKDDYSPEGELWTSSFVQAYPYVPYEKNVTIKSNDALLKKTHQSIPEMFFNKYCEFEINLDVNETQWTVSEWREMGKRIIRDIYSVNPFASENISDNQNDDEFSDDEISHDDSLLQHSQERDEALVMNLVGTMESPNCDFTLSLNATAFRTDWEQTKYKATIYSVYMMLASLAQIVVLLRQLIHAQSQLATRVSLLCIGWHTVIDAVLCIEHIMLCLMVPPISTAFCKYIMMNCYNYILSLFNKTYNWNQSAFDLAIVMVALFKFLLFYVIEMKYMVMIMEARSSAAGLPNSASDVRRRLAALQFRFFSGLFLSIIGIWYFIFGQYRRKLVFMVMYSFWVPQIIYNIFTEAKKPLHKHFIYGNSITRLNLPLILFGIPKNFMQEIEPEFPLDHQLCLMLIIWVAIQTGLLMGQMKYGARFMIPQR